MLTTPMKMNVAGSVSAIGSARVSPHERVHNAQDFHERAGGKEQGVRHEEQDRDPGAGREFVPS